MIGIPTDLLGVSWFGDFAAMTALGVGSIVIGIIKTNGFIIDIFGHSFPVITNIFGEGVDLMASNMFKYMPHGIMIGAGLVSLIQCGVCFSRRVTETVQLVNLHPVWQT